MGACYSTSCKLVCKNEEDVIRLARGYIQDASGYARFSSSDFNNLDGMMEVFFTNGVEKDRDGTYTADFDASYGWESIMQEMFEAIAPALEDGSYLEIYPDNWKDILVVREGKVEFSQEELDNDEEGYGCPVENEEGKTTFCDPEVISEEIEYTGGGVNYLVYEIRVKEDGQDSVLFATYNPYGEEFIIRRASILDPYETDGSEEWCNVPEGIESCPVFHKIFAELKQATLMMWHELYIRKYPERKYEYKPTAVYVDPDNGKSYRQVFSMKKKGETILYGYIVDKKTHEADYDHVVRIGAGPLDRPDGSGNEEEKA